MSADVLEHVDAPVEYLKESYRVLKKDGLLLLTTPNGLIARKNRCIIKNHSRFHITEYYPSELSEMISNCGFSIVESFSSIDIRGRGYRIGQYRKIFIITLCKLGLLEIAKKTKRALFETRARNISKTINNYTKDFAVTKMDLNQINGENCDVIFIVAKR